MLKRRHPGRQGPDFPASSSAGLLFRGQFGTRLFKQSRRRVQGLLSRPRPLPFGSQRRRQFFRLGGQLRDGLGTSREVTADSRKQNIENFYLPARFRADVLLFLQFGACLFERLFRGLDVCRRLPVPLLLYGQQGEEFPRTRDQAGYSFVALGNFLSEIRDSLLKILARSTCLRPFERKELRYRGDLSLQIVESPFTSHKNVAEKKLRHGKDHHEKDDHHQQRRQGVDETRPDVRRLPLPLGDACHLGRLPEPA